MNLRDLEYLVAVADHGNFRRAALACDVTQPTLSTQVKKLEAELGALLLDRSATPLRLTPVGEEVVRRARRLLHDAAQLRDAVRAQAHPEAGTLRLGVFPTLGSYLLPRVLPGVRARFPDVALLITEEKSNELLALLAAGELDAVTVALPVASPDLTVRPLFREEFLLAVPTGHPLADGDGPLPARRIAGSDVLLMTTGHCLGEQVNDWLGRIGGRPREDFRATTLESLRSMVAAGGGATLLPALSVQAPVAQATGVVVRPVIQPVPSRDIALVWRTGSARGDLLAKLGPALVPPDALYVRPLLDA